jgi:hypothetical protein
MGDDLVSRASAGRARGLRARLSLFSAVRGPVGLLYAPNVRGTAWATGFLSWRRGNKREERSSIGSQRVYMNWIHHPAGIAARPVVDPELAHLPKDPAKMGRSLAKREGSRMRDRSSYLTFISTQSVASRGVAVGDHAHAVALIDEKAKAFPPGSVSRPAVGTILVRFAPIRS